LFVAAMVAVLNLYVDDSGSRKLDRKDDTPHAKRNWFGLGGVMLKDADEDKERRRYDRFMSQWPELVSAPLHSADIRNKTKSYTWLSKDPARATRFFEGLTELICGSSVICIAAVIDRSGYRARYEPKYQPEDRWLLCKTAFAILVERAAKHAIRQQHRMRVLVENGDKKTDARMSRYYNELKAQGMPFNATAMTVYQPLPAETLAATLYEFRIKNKTSPMMQLADLCLYPICRGGYEPTYRSYQDLGRSQRLLDAQLDPADIPTHGIKYSCFEGVAKPV
jgi:hypothetical protein